MKRYQLWLTEVARLTWTKGHFRPNEVATDIELKQWHKNGVSPFDASLRCANRVIRVFDPKTGIITRRR